MLIKVNVQEILFKNLKVNRKSNEQLKWIGSIEKCDACRRLLRGVFLNLKTSFFMSGDISCAFQ